MAAYERLAVQAALDGDPIMVRKALLAHPLVGQWAPTEQLFERMFESVLRAAR